MEMVLLFAFACAHIARYWQPHSLQHTLLIGYYLLYSSEISASTVPLEREIIPATY